MEQITQPADGKKDTKTMDDSSGRISTWKMQLEKTNGDSCTTCQYSPHNKACRTCYSVTRQRSSSCAPTAAPSSMSSSFLPPPSRRSELTMSFGRSFVQLRIGQCISKHPTAHTSSESASRKQLTSDRDGGVWRCLCQWPNKKINERRRWTGATSASFTRLITQIGVPACYNSSLDVAAVHRPHL